MIQLWLIPILPLLGFVLNGLFGRKLAKPAVNVIAIGSVLLSFLWVLKTLNALGVFTSGTAMFFVTGPVTSRASAWRGEATRRTP